jgi:putative transposase
MARPLRIEFPGAVYHVSARGNNRQAIFSGDSDKELFLYILQQTLKSHNVLCFAYCLMTNHYHLMIETPEGNLSHFMKQLNGMYSQRYNYQNQRVGHLFQGRFKSIVVEKQTYLLELCRYIVLNPVRAGMVAHPGKYPYSSYNDTAGAADAACFLSIDWLLAQFGNNRHEAQAEYRSFVQAGLEAQSPWRDLQGQCILGDKAFVEQLTPYTARGGEVREVPVFARNINRPQLSEIFPAEIRSSKRMRNEAMYKAYAEHGYKQKEISIFLNLHYSTVSNILKKHQNKRPDPDGKDRFSS